MHRQSSFRFLFTLFILAASLARGQAEHPDYRYLGITSGPEHLVPSTYELHAGRYNKLYIESIVASQMSQEEIESFLSFVDILHERWRMIFGEDWDLFAGENHFKHYLTTGVTGTGTGDRGTSWHIGDFGLDKMGEERADDGLLGQRWMQTAIHELVHLWDFRSFNWLQGPDPAHAFNASMQEILSLRMAAYQVGVYNDRQSFFPPEQAFALAYKLKRGRYFDEPTVSFEDYLTAEALERYPRNYPEGRETLNIQGFLLIAIYQMHGLEAVQAVLAEVDKLGFGRGADFTNAERNRHMIKAFGDALKFDVSNYFDYWKFPIPSDLRSYLAQYPANTTMLQDGDSDGFSPMDGDFDDGNNAIYPDAPELNDGIDNNQDGQVDENVYVEGSADYPASSPTTTVQLPALIQGTISSLSDVDTLKFNLPVKSYVTFLIVGKESDSTMTYFDERVSAASVRMSSPVWNAAFINGDLYDLVVTPLEAGSHEIRILADDERLPNPGDYEVQVFISDFTPPDEVENDLRFSYHAFTTASADPSFDGSSVRGIPSDEGVELVKIFHNLGGANWRDSRGWLADRDAGFWRGVNAGRNGVDKLDFGNRAGQLVGDLSTVDWSTFSNLRYLHLGIPNHIGKLPESMVGLPLDVLSTYGHSLTLANTRMQLWYESIPRREGPPILPDASFITQAVPPEIIIHPQSIIMPNGTDWTLKARAIGSGAVTYQWKKDGNIISGATDQELILTDAVQADSGSYVFEAISALGTVVSEPALVQVNPPASIVAEPSGGVTKVYLATTGDWSVTGVPDWITASPQNGSGPATVTLTISPNGSVGTRSATFSTDSQEYSVSQGSLSGSVFATFDGDFSGGILTTSGNAEPVITGEDGVRISSLKGGVNNAMAWPKIDLTGRDAFRLSFDFKMSTDAANTAAGGCCENAADGIGIGLFSTDTYAASGAINPAADTGVAWENPSDKTGFVDALTLGFAVFGSDIIRVHGPGGSSNSLAQRTPSFELNDNQVHHAELIVDKKNGTPTATLKISGENHSTLTVLNNKAAPNFAFEGTHRLILGSRTGAAYVETWVDNLILEPITRQTPVVNWQNPPALTFGNRLSAAQLNAQSAIPGTFNYSPGQNALLNAGADQTLSVSFIPDDALTYEAVTKTVKITVNKATPTITWNTPASITYGTSIAASLNANASNGAAITYAPSGGILAAGTHPLTASLPETSNFNAASMQVTLTVTQRPLTIAANNQTRAAGAANPPLTVNYNGLTNGDSAPATLPTLSTSANASSAPGAYPITVTGGADPNYAITRVDGTLTVAPKQIPTITWANSTIIYGTAIGGTQLNATSSVEGSFSYSPSAGTIPNSGTHTLTANFTPTNGTASATASNTVTLTVSPAALNVTADDKQRGAGVANPSFTASYSGFVNGDTALATPPSLSTSATIASEPGSYPITVSGGGDPNYAITRINGTLTIEDKEIPVIAWSTPAAITYGETLGASLLSATADVAGTFSYSPASGALLNAGQHTLTADFTPTDGVAFANASRTVTLTVAPKALTIAAQDATRGQGQSDPTFTAIYSGFINGETAQSLATPVSLTTTATSSSPAGNYPITASGAASPNYAITFVPGTLTVTADNRPIPLPTLRASTNGFELAWPTNDGWTLMESTDMKTWTPVNEQLVEQDGDTTTMQSPIQGQSRRYFRFQKK